MDIRTENQIASAAAHLVSLAVPPLQPSYLHPAAPATDEQVVSHSPPAIPHILSAQELQAACCESRPSWYLGLL
jgi:hypothetical protein